MAKHDTDHPQRPPYTGAKIAVARLTINGQPTANGLYVFHQHSAYPQIMQPGGVVDGTWDEIKAATQAADTGGDGSGPMGGQTGHTYTGGGDPDVEAAVKEYEAYWDLTRKPRH
jgi:hypothetical protein